MYPSNTMPSTESLWPQRWGGAALISAAIAFSAVFTILAMRMGYPDVLDLPVDKVYPKLVEGGEALRVVWFIYAFIPFALLPTAFGARAAFPEQPLKMQAAVVLASLAALFMFLGLIRWPTVHWVLAQSTNTPSATLILTPWFDAINLLLGNLIGEFAGEMALAGFFLLVSLAIVGVKGWIRWLGYFGAAFSVALMLGAWRNAWSVVQPITDATNFILPLYMTALGVSLMFNFFRPRTTQQFNQE
jgi:hypothetical protein